MENTCTVVFIEGLVTQIIARARVPILANTADHVKSPTLSPGYSCGVSIFVKFPTPKGNIFSQKMSIACVGPGGGGGGGGGVQLTGALLLKDIFLITVNKLKT